MPSASVTTVPWTVAGVGEAAAAAEARAAVKLGPAPTAATGKALTAGELGSAARHQWLLEWRS